MKREGVTERNANSVIQTRCEKTTRKINVNTETTVKTITQRKNAHFGPAVTAKKGNTAT